jgi:hypothetical protein
LATIATITKIENYAQGQHRWDVRIHPATRWRRAGGAVDNATTTLGAEATLLRDRGGSRNPAPVAQTEPDLSREAQVAPVATSRDAHEASAAGVTSVRRRG